MGNNITNENYNLLSFYKSVDESRRIDNSFALEDDEPLTAEEKKEIDEFWGKYKFAYPNIDYKSFQTFKNRFGKFDVRHCPGAIRTHYLNKWFNSSAYMVSGQNKAMLPMLYPNIKQPKTIIRRMCGLYYDENYNNISMEDAIDIILSTIKNGCSLILKPSNKGGGRGIVFIDPGDKSEVVQDKIKSVNNGAFVIQEILEQSGFMKAFNPTSVNTIRATTMLFKGKVYLLAALIRIGKVGNKVDNYSQGGSILGVDKETGRCNDWALTHSNRKVSVLPSGLDLSEKKLIVPNFEKIKEAVHKAHYYMPYIKMISWDIALDQKNDPVLIENNFAGMIQIHEAVTGPLFGDLMKPILDTYLLNNFFVEFDSGEWKCKEFYNGIVLTEYTGSAEEVFVPQMINNKIVTKIDSIAFGKYKKIKKISIPALVAKKSATALSKVDIIEKRG